MKIAFITWVPPTDWELAYPTGGLLIAIAENDGFPFSEFIALPPHTTDDLLKKCQDFLIGEIEKHAGQKYADHQATTEAGDRPPELPM